MKRRLTQEQEQIARLLSTFADLPADAKEGIIGYAAGVADASMRYRTNAKEAATANVR